MSIDAQELRAYLARWQAVAAFEAAEQKAATFTLRWQQLNAILRLAAALGISPEADSEAIEAVRSRWNRLKDTYQSGT